MSFITTFLIILIFVLAFSKEPSSGRTAARILLWATLVVFILLFMIICSALM